MIPASGRARKELTKAFVSYQSAAGDKYVYLVDLGFFGFDTGDGQHPAAAGHKTIYTAALPALDAILKGRYISPVTIPLWTGTAPEGENRSAGNDPAITLYRPVKPNGAAVIVCPGGGYGMLVTGPEGHGIALWLNQRGITAFVLEYRLPNGNPRIPLLDAQRAIRMARAMAPDLSIDVNRVGIMGFSAGGHLASTAATHFDRGDKSAADPVGRFSSRPDFAILVYPVITMGADTHRGSTNNLLGPDPDDSLINLYSNERQVTRQTPPAFLAHAQDDDVVVPDNSRKFYDALVTNKVPAFYLKLPSGGHGLNGYSGPMWDEWQAKSLQWMADMKIIPNRGYK
jgi:acetyl esterase/lipase